MKNEYTVITDPKEIAKLNEDLARRLSKTFKNQESREISYPAGHENAIVYFEDGKIENARAWAPLNKNGKLLNVILIGERNTSKYLEISVQINFPGDKYNRRLAGAFIRDSAGDIFIAHRGKLTKGRSALKQKSVFREFSHILIEAQDNEKLSKLILISNLDATDLADRLWEFALEARDVATRLGAQKEIDGIENDEENLINTTSTPHPVTDKLPNTQDRMLRLRDYFDEFSGTSEVKGYGSGKRTVEHGDIVKALEALLSNRGKTQKSQAIDLAVVTNDEVDLFEVKTSARPTNIYTAIGQLFIHGESIKQRLDLPVKKHLVLPEQPNPEHAQHITIKGGMNIVVYEKSNGIYHFNGI